MISLHPDYSIPDTNKKEYTIMVVGDELFDFEEYEGHEMIGTYTDALLMDLVELESLQLIPGKLTIQNIDAALKHMKVVYTVSGSTNDEWTNILHDTLKIKFLLHNDNS